MASAIFSVPVDEVTSEQRFVGKTASLGCQFGMSWRKFQTACRNYGKELPDKICQLAVYRYRKRRDQIVRAWKQFQITAVLAVNNPGTMFFPETSIGKISFSYGRIGGFPALAMYLPSGHMLVYPEPTVVAKEVTADILQENEAGELVNVVHTFVVDEVSFYGPIPLKTGWGRIHTHGGKLFENAVQATAGDFMTHSLIQIERAGFEPFATIHDQVLCPMRSGSSAVTFEKVFTRLPAWASDFPLEASVKITPFYQKT
jgi:DNA polymerase